MTVATTTAPSLMRTPIPAAIASKRAQRAHTSNKVMASLSQVKSSHAFGDPTSLTIGPFASTLQLPFPTGSVTVDLGSKCGGDHEACVCIQELVGHCLRRGDFVRDRLTKMASHWKRCYGSPRGRLRSASTSTSSCQTYQGDTLRFRREMLPPPPTP